MAQPVTLVAADPHWSPNPRDAYRWIFLEETLPALIKEHDVGRLLLLGDFTEAKDDHPAALVNRLVDGIAALAAQVHIYALKGNHDYVAEDIPFYRFLRHVPRVRWINEPLALNLRGLGKCLFLPHTKNPTEEWKSWLTESHDWAFAHQTVDGSTLGHGVQAKGFPSSILKGVKVISGDVHVPQTIKNWTYVGAPYQVDFGDSYVARVLLITNGVVKSLPVAGPQKRLIDMEIREGSIHLKRII